MGVGGVSSLRLEPTYSIISSTVGYVPDATNLVGVDPLIQAAYDTSVSALPWRTNPHFVGVLLVAVDLPPNLMGDYHLQITGTPPPAIDAGTPSVVVNGELIRAPIRDIDLDLRPSGAGYEIGADEIGPYSVFLNVLPGTAVGPFFSVYLPVIRK